MKDIVIIGNGGLARELKMLIDDINQEKKTWNFCGFVCSNNNDSSNDYIFGDDDYLLNYKDEVHAVIGIGTPSIIASLFDKFCTVVKLPNLVHPSVIGNLKNYKLGIGNIFCAGNIFTVNISIGNGNYFNLASTFGHDTQIGNFNVINPGVNCSGNVTLGNTNLIGTGATILQGLTIGNNNILGANSLLTKSYFDNHTTLIGVPAKPKSN